MAKPSRVRPSPSISGSASPSSSGSRSPPPRGKRRATRIHESLVLRLDSPNSVSSAPKRESPKSDNTSGHVLKAGPKRPERKERSYLQFIKIETKKTPISTPNSSSLTRSYFDAPLDSKCFYVGALDELFVRVGTRNKLIYNADWSGADDANHYFSWPADKRWLSRWSPRAPLVAKLFKLVLPDLQGLWLKIFDVRTGTGIVGLNNAGVADSPQWPVIRWAGGEDDEYFATFNKNNTASVYETKNLNLLLDVDDVIDISWSPTEPVLAILLKAGGKQPVKALLLRIPGMQRRTQ
ncbi:eukaryotic translation initiation factor 3 subunit B-like isoform X2 [Raphanus sativus]|nr:eukaryotic translation initiation factor 3 subunit B-like isoform X2 [Raphanus sativus]